MKLEFIDGGKFLDGGMRRPKWMGLCIGLAIVFGVLMASPVAQAITIW